MSGEFAAWALAGESTAGDAAVGGAVVAAGATAEEGAVAAGACGTVGATVVGASLRKRGCRQNEDGGNKGRHDGAVLMTLRGH